MQEKITGQQSSWLQAAPVISIMDYGFLRTQVLWLNRTGPKHFIHTGKEGGSASLGLGLPNTQYLLVPGARGFTEYVNVNQALLWLVYSPWKSRACQALKSNNQEIESSTLSLRKRNIMGLPQGWWLDSFATKWHTEKLFPGVKAPSRFKKD